MSYEKPWSKEFDSLLEKMTARWGGEIDGPEDLAKDDRRKRGDTNTSFAQAEAGHAAGPIDLYYYPRYTAVIDNHTISMTVWEYPFPGTRMMEGEDNIEYLLIVLHMSCNHRIAVRHEHFMDRFKKKVGLEYELQTGDGKFDRDYFLITRPKENIEFLKLPVVQKTIRDMEPFAGISFGMYGISFSRELCDEKQFDIAEIKSIVHRLIGLAAAVPSK